MGSTVILFYMSLFIVLTVKGNEVNLPCYPTNEGNFSSYTASAAIYNITKNTENAATDATIFCSINDERDRFAEMEFAIYGEPPKSLSLVAEYDTLSSLNGLSVFCCADDILKINRVLPDNYLKSYQNITSMVEYKCTGVKELTIELAGIHLLNMDPSINRNRRDALQVPENCERSKKENGIITSEIKHLGEVCGCASGSCRWMTNDTGHLVCSLCCEEHHWSLTNLTCVACPVCTTSKSANPFTSCLPISKCNRSETPRPIHTSDETEQQSFTEVTQLSEKPTSAPQILKETTSAAEKNDGLNTNVISTTESNEETTALSKIEEDDGKTAPVQSPIGECYQAGVPLGWFFFLIVLALGSGAAIGVVFQCHYPSIFPDIFHRIASVFRRGYHLVRH